MPWRKLTHSHNMKIYKEIMGDIIKSPINADITIMAVLFRTELFKRDFTKRQINILLLIYTLSLSLGKESAYIPNYHTDFSIAGVSHKKIKNEIDKLMKMNVILWEKEENLFSINTPQSWEVPCNQAYDKERLKQLFMLNLEHLGIDVSSIIEKLKRRTKR